MIRARGLILRYTAVCRFGCGHSCRKWTRRSAVLERDLHELLCRMNHPWEA